MSVSSDALRTAGSRTRSPPFLETSIFSAEKPNAPAIPQQPVSGTCTSAPVFCSSATSWSIFMIAFWWKWPWSRDHRQTGVDFAAERVHHPAQVCLGAIEHAEVIERPPAAKMRHGDTHAESGGTEHLRGGDRRLGVEIVVEGVGPKDDLAGGGA